MAFTSTKVAPSGSVISLTNESFQFGNSPFANSIGEQDAIGVSINSGATTASVVLSVTEPDTTYGVWLLPSYSTTTFVSAKSTSSFLVGFGTAPANNTSTFNWLLMR